MKWFQLPLIGVIACALSVACGPDNFDNDGFGDDADNDDTDVDEFLGDGEIAQIVIAVNEGEIDIATAARSRVRSPAASDLAESMVQAYQEMNADLDAILADSHIEPEANEVADDVESAASFIVREMNNAAVASVDRVFLEGQAQFLLDVRNLIDDELIAAANDNDLRDFLELMLEDVTAHYNAAIGALGELDGVTQE